jgi:hypothetical protein
MSSLVTVINQTGRSMGQFSSNLAYLDGLQNSSPQLMKLNCEKKLPTNLLSLVHQLTPISHNLPINLTTHSFYFLINDVN